VKLFEAQFMWEKFFGDLFSEKQFPWMTEGFRSLHIT
jgi:hypothetical protein